MLNVIIPTDHPDSASPLLRFAAQAFVLMGARVEIALGGENLVMSLVRSPPTDAPIGPNTARNRAEAPTALVQAEGLPNLLHELAHAVQAGHLDDDYGFDYGAIPFDLETAAGRAVLWNELACCVTSCAYLQTHGRAARAGAPPAEVQAEVHAWFREQVEILPVFYGLDRDPPAFAARVAVLLHTHHHEAHAVLTRAYAAIERALTSVGADPALAAVASRPPLATLWSLLGHGHSAAPSPGPAAQAPEPFP